MNPRDIFNNDDHLWPAIEEQLLASAQYKGVSRRLRRAQTALHMRARGAVWRCFLRVEELQNERCADALVAVARWAFERGVLEGQARRRGDDA